METGITEILLVDHLDGTPAKVHREKGIMLIDREKWSRIPQIRRKFILFHEAGHATLKTKNEILADRWAMDRMIEAGLSLTEALKSLTRILNANRPGHYRRIIALFHYICQYDYFINGNKKIAE